jgi:hypothetical protein
MANTQANKKISGVTAGLAKVAAGGGAGPRVRSAPKLEVPLALERAPTEGKPKGDQRRSAGQDLTALLIVALGSVLFLSLISYGGEGSNWMGAFGEHLAGVLLHLLGLGGFLLAGVVAAVGGLMLVGVRLEMKPSEFVGQMLFVIGGGVFFHLWMPGEKVLGHMPGGAVGALGGEVGRSFFGGVGVWLICAVMAMGGLMLASDASLGNVMARGWAALRAVGARAKVAASEVWARRALAMRRAPAAEPVVSLDVAPAIAPAPAAEVAAAPAPVKAAPAPVKPTPVKAAPPKHTPAPVKAAPATAPLDEAEERADAMQTQPPVAFATGPTTARHRVASILAKLPQGARQPVEVKPTPSPAAQAVEEAPTARAVDAAALAAWNPSARRPGPQPSAPAAR